MDKNNVTRKFYDCHLHLPIKSDNAVKKFLSEIDENRINGFILILNSVLEEDIYLDNMFLFNKRNYKVALILDIHSEKWLEAFRKLENKGIEYIVKIHPRISNITKKDFELIKEALSKLSYQIIIIDGWFFGPQLNNHVGVELAIYLAFELPEKTIVIAHSGGHKLVETMLLTRPLKNIYYDLSLTQLYFSGSSIESDIDYFIKWSSERIFFGSDYPDFGIREAWLAFQQHYIKANKGDRLDKSFELVKTIYGLK